MSNYGAGMTDDLWQEGYDEGAQDSMLRANQIERVLTDLIEDLVGDDGDRHEVTDDGRGGCAVCTAIDRAEARLREVQGE